MSIKNNINNLLESLKNQLSDSFNFDLFKVLYLLFFLIIYFWNIQLVATADATRPQKQSKKI